MEKPSHLFRLITSPKLGKLRMSFAKFLLPVEAENLEVFWVIYPYCNKLCYYYKQTLNNMKLYYIIFSTYTPTCFSNKAKYYYSHFTDGKLRKWLVQGIESRSHESQSSSLTTSHHGFHIGITSPTTEIQLILEWDTWLLNSTQYDYTVVYDRVKLQLLRNFPKEHSSVVKCTFPWNVLLSVNV